MRESYNEVREQHLSNPQINDRRTAAYALSIRKLPIFTTACIYRVWKTLHFRMPLLIASTKLLNLLIPVSSSLAKKKAKQRADFLRKIADNLETHRNSSSKLQSRKQVSGS